VRAIETLHADHPIAQIDRLAHHAFRGELWDKAALYCRQAGAKAAARSAYRDAVALYEQALDATRHLPDSRDIRQQALELRLALGRSLHLLGEYGRYLALLGEAEALARALDDRIRLGLVLTQMARVLRQTGDPDDAMAAGQQALELAAALSDRALQAEAAFYLGQVYWGVGDFGRAAALLRWIVEAADQESGRPSIDRLIGSQAWLARTLSALGAFAEGRRHGEEALRLATREGRGNLPILARGYLGELYLAQGDLERAIRVWEEGLALCRASDDRNDLRPIVAGLGFAYALQGRLAEGRALLEEGINEGLGTGSLLNVAYRVAWLSEVCRLAGHPEEAWQHACQALDLARRLKARGGEALALHQLGVVQAHADPSDAAQAEAHYQQALALAEALGMRALMAHCHLGLGTMYAKIGQREPARAELSTAIVLYRAMDMTFWLPQAEATLKDLG
jgi:tetratricopeptide (TPR) repeat protein